MNGRTAWMGVVLLALSALGTTGCLGMLKQGYSEARGARGEVLPITENFDGPLARMQSIEFTPATTTVGSRICSPELLRAYDRNANQVVARLKPLYPGGTPLLRIDSELLYFQKKGLLGGAMLLARVKLHADDRLVLDALVKVESDAFRAGGEEDLAQGATDALRKFLELRKQRGGRDGR